MAIQKPKKNKRFIVRVTEDELNKMKDIANLYTGGNMTKAFIKMMDNELKTTIKETLLDLKKSIEDEKAFIEAIKHLTEEGDSRITDLLKKIENCNNFMNEMLNKICPKQK